MVRTTYIRRDGPQERGQVSYAPYEDGAALSVRALILSARFVEIDYSRTGSGSCSWCSPLTFRIGESRTETAEFPCGLARIGGGHDRRDYGQAVGARLQHLRGVG